MKKTKLFLLLGMLMSYLPLGLTNNPIQVIAEEAPIKLEYDEERDVNGVDVYRTIKNYYPAEINESFKAPNGSVFTLTAEKEMLLPFISEIKNLEELDGRDDIPMMGVVVNRELNNVSFYSESSTTWNICFDDIADYICTELSQMVLYEIEEKTEEFVIGGYYDVQLYMPGSFDAHVYHYIFPVHDYTVTPYVNGDIIFAHAFTYCGGDDSRISSYAEIVADIFNDEYGFKTDGRTPDPYEEGKYIENYKISYIQKETNTIVESDNSNIELHTIPTKPMTLYAKLAFSSGGKEYSFYSNEFIAEEKVPNGYLDNFNNRDTIGLADKTSHKLVIGTVLPHEEIYQAMIRLYYFDNNQEVLFGEHEYSSEIAGEGVGIKDEFFEFPISFNKPGEYKIYANIDIFTTSYYYHNYSQWYRTIKVVEGVVPYTSDIKEAFKLNITVNGNELNKDLITESGSNEYQITCIAGGEPIVITSHIAEDLLNTNEVESFEINDNITSTIQVKSEDNGSKITVYPSSGGLAKLEISANVRGFGLIKKVFNFRVISDYKANSYISIPEEFHYSGKDLPVTLKFIENDAEINFVNYKATWKVTDINNEEREVPFEVTSDLSMKLVNPQQGSYLVTANFNGFAVTTTTIEVRTVNVDLFVKQNIWWLLLVSLGLMVLAIVTKILLSKKTAVVDTLSLVYKKAKEIDVTEADSNKKLNKVKIMLQAQISYTRSMNIDGMNQYEKTIRYLVKSYEDLEALEKIPVTDATKRLEAFEQLDKDLSKAFLVVTDIQRAKAIAEENSLKANTNNYAKLEEEKKSKKRNKSN